MKQKTIIRYNYVTILYLPCYKSKASCIRRVFINLILAVLFRVEADANRDRREIITS